jgi:hypothetical protein
MEITEEEFWEDRCGWRGLFGRTHTRITKLKDEETKIRFYYLHLSVCRNIMFLLFMTFRRNAKKIDQLVQTLLLANVFIVTRIPCGTTSLPPAIQDECW